MQVKNWMLTLLLMAGFTGAAAQNNDTPAFSKSAEVPELYLIQTDSSVLTKASLKNQPTLIMFFSPSCDHCQHQWADMIQHKEQLKNIQIVMATYQPFEEMVDFYKKEQIASQWPNIRLGRDTNFKLVPFFKIRSLPYQALFNRHGNLIATYESNVKVEKMLEAFNSR